MCPTAHYVSKTGWSFEQEVGASHQPSGRFRNMVLPILGDGKSVAGNKHRPLFEMRDQSINYVCFIFCDRVVIV